MVLAVPPQSCMDENRRQLARLAWHTELHELFVIDQVRDRSGLATQANDQIRRRHWHDWQSRPAFALSCWWSSPPNCMPQPPLCVSGKMPSTFGNGASSERSKRWAMYLLTEAEQLTRRDDGDVVARGGLAVRAPIAHERAAFDRRRLGRDFGGVFIVSGKLTGRHVVDMNPIARLDGRGGETNRLAVAHHGGAFGYWQQRDLVPLLDRAGKRDGVGSGRHFAAGRQRADGNADIIGRVNMNGVHGIGNEHDERSWPRRGASKGRAKAQLTPAGFGLQMAFRAAVGCQHSPRWCVWPAAFMMLQMKMTSFEERRQLESLDAAALEQRQLQRLNRLLEQILPANPFYNLRLADVQRPLRSLHDLRSLPYTFKEGLLSSPPTGELAYNRTFPLEKYVRFHQTSGTRGRPLVVLDTAEDWAWWLDCWQYVLDSAEVTAKDCVFMAFSFGPFIGFWSAYDAAATPAV